MRSVSRDATRSAYMLRNRIPRSGIVAAAESSRRNPSSAERSLVPASEMSAVRRPLAFVNVGKKLSTTDMSSSVARIATRNVSRSRRWSTGTSDRSTGALPRSVTTVESLRSRSAPNCRRRFA